MSRSCSLILSCIGLPVSLCQNNFDTARDKRFSFIAGSKQLQGFTQIKQGHRLEMHLVLLVGLCIFGTTSDLKRFKCCVRILESKQKYFVLHFIDRFFLRESLEMF